MASKRDLKKVVHYLTNEFVGDALLYLLIEEKNEAEVESLVEKAVNLEQEKIDEVNAKNIEGSKKKYYTGIRTETVEKIDGFYGELIALMK
ncbi:hypothetical protein [Persicobacter diffluens]|uniref:Uncharacterized protein n=1 Tax=Persicobacter diffluens TaxID=981 RepID=A0AAN5ALE5_9BACT|nr:hypothetical protein PEDI_44170 [Persicobacter diffluens]